MQKCVNWHAFAALNGRSSIGTADHHILHCTVNSCGQVKHGHNEYAAFHFNHIVNPKHGATVKTLALIRSLGQNGNLKPVSYGNIRFQAQVTDFSIHLFPKI